MDSASKRQKKGNKKGGGSGTNRQVVDLTKFGFTSSSAEKRRKKRTP